MIRREDRARLNAATDAEAVAFLSELHADDAADLLAELDDDRHAAILSALPEGQRRRVRVLLGELPATAGALMSRDFLCLNEHTTVSHALDRARTSRLDPAAVDVIFVINDHGRLTGSIPLKRLLEAAPDAWLQDIEPVGTPSLRVDADLDEIARLITDLDLPVAPVVDDESRIAGVITADDVLELLSREQRGRGRRP